MRSTFGGMGQIETDGLVRYFDASNPNSYSGSGRTWNDLSKNGSTVLTTGSTGIIPTFTTSNGGAITFTAANSQSVPVGNLALGNTFTILAWIKPTSVASGIYNVYGADSNGQDNYFGHSTNQVQLLFTSASNIGNTNVLGGTLSTTSWNFIGGSVNVNTGKIYLNGEEVGSQTVVFNTNIAPWSGSASSIGRRAGINSNFFGGDISRIWIYDRVLSLDSIRQNYNTTKGRYGL